MMRRAWGAAFLTLGCARHAVTGRVVLPPNLQPARGLQANVPMPALPAWDGKSPHVEGVCRRTGSELACWDPLGRRKSDLAPRASRILAAAKRPLLTSGGPERLVVFFSAEKFGWSFELTAGIERVSSDALLMKDEAASSGSLLFNRQIPLAHPVPLRLQEGATTSIVSEELRVDSIARVGREWRIVVALKTVSNAISGLEIVSSSRRFHTRRERLPGLPPGRAAFLIDKDPARVGTVYVTARLNSGVSQLGFMLNPW